MTIMKYTKIVSVFSIYSTSSAITRISKILVNVKQQLSLCSVMDEHITTLSAENDLFDLIEITVLVVPELK